MREKVNNDLASFYSAAKSPIYGNCEVFNPKGELIFRCLERRAKWYLNRNLATVIKHSPLRIQLTFTPKGNGNKDDEFSLALKFNKCVCCGTKENLTRHHIIPRCYKKHIPLNLKIRDSHDVVVLCINCHINYERKADLLKQELADKYKVHFQSKVDQSVYISKVVKAAKLLSLPKTNRIDPANLVKAQMIVEGFLQKNDLTTEDIEQVRKKSFRLFHNNENAYGELIMEHVTDIQGFFEMWRQHFLDEADPQYLPQHWEVNRKLMCRK